MYTNIYIYIIICYEESAVGLIYKLMKTTGTFFLCPVTSISIRGFCAGSQYFLLKVSTFLASAKVIPRDFNSMKFVNAELRMK